MAEIGVACQTCSFFAAVNEKEGVCKANPPIPFLVPGAPDALGRPSTKIVGIWVSVGASDWCGKHSSFGMASAMPIDVRLTGKPDGLA